jgi:5-methyltetrahydrofolate--homocysteine methyltransferase
VNHEQFARLVKQGPLLLDGATGTRLQAVGMPAGACPETWVLEHPSVLQDLQWAYYAAGSQIIYAFTFGANRPKLWQHQVELAGVEEINRRLAMISITVRDKYRLVNPDCSVFVAGDLAPTGHFLFPAGDLTLDELIAIYREQVRGLLAAGVDLFVIETMMDLAETRAAVLAIQAECDLPVLASLTYEANGRTLAGNSPLESLVTLASLGVAACGINCSFGPEKLGELIEPLRLVSPVPLLLKPNAGLPSLVDGQTVFPMDPLAFAAVMEPLVTDCVRLLGGCCGTGPDHIACLRQALDHTGKTSGIAKFVSCPKLPDMICSSRQTWLVGKAADLPVVECNDPDSLIDDVYKALELEPPAIILDLDAAADDDNLPSLLEALEQLQIMVSVPLVFRSVRTGLLELLLFHYCGRAGVVGGLPDQARGALSL